ncbi:MAG: 30S ribosomal protein S6 [Dehalococcoidia bacterium]
MREYELVTVWNPDLGEEGITGQLERLGTAIAGRGGAVRESNIWGRRRLAYHINRHSEGVYVVMQVEMEPGRTAELERQLSINEDVLRHLLVRKDE